MHMAAILFNGSNLFDQIVNILSPEGPISNLLKLFKRFQRRRRFFFYNFIHVYSPGARADNPKILIVLNSFTSLIIHCRFQPLVFNIWENDFLTFSPYKIY